MEIYQLKVFLAVARCLNFTEAAKSLNLTQPAVSAKIKSLESELKISLFVRLGRQIQLTDIGQYLVKEAEKLVELETEISRKVENFRQYNLNQITIGSSQGLAQSWLPKIIYQYRQKYPEIQTKLEVFNNGKLLEKAIIQNNIDVGFSEAKLSDCPEIAQRGIASIQYSLIVASDRLLAKKNWQTLIDIQHKPLVLLSDRFASRQVFVSRIAKLGLKPTDFPRIETVDTINLMRAYLTQGDYIGFASDLEFQAELNAKLLTAITLQEFALPASIYLSLRRKTAKAIDNRKTSTPVKKFLTLFPTASAPKSPTFANKNRNAEKTITINLGVQNGTIPTITAGLIVQRLRLLEQFLPRTGRYAQIKYDIQWHNFLSGMPIAEGLHSQKLDIGILGDYPLLQSAIPHSDRASSSNTQLVSFVSINPDGDGNAVIVPQTSKLETIEDLKGETVALPFGSSAHGMLLRTLSHLDLLSEVQLFPLKNSQLKTPSDPKIAAGYAYFSPFHQLACDRGNFKYLFNGNLSPLPGFYGVVVSQSFANRYPEIIVSYLKALIAAQYWLTNTPSAFYLVSKWTKIKPQILANTLSSCFSEATSSLFVTDWQIRPDWAEEHINKLQAIPHLQSLKDILLARWIQSEFLQIASQN
ncbi:Transcriptional regulator [Hyella patelloides LEGE 07179]|uniref:Transcriptional regulator n=1 Tax=Hyella patelloides LEGE 07179 TaxID=945734 RepID=A0A563VW13_9CYAN|nr:LysR substrate-binding domain-containing protein [Hyella patelloides]VEP15606.1 Transcriptional regulator [Hyella patelloides LEGE 07179]